MKNAKFLPLLLGGLIFPAFIFSAVVPFRSLDLPGGVPDQNEYYSIQSIAFADEPGFLKFKVHSQHADYEVTGVVPLLKLLHEIEVIERIRRDEDTSGFFDGASASVEATKDGFVNLVSHPVESVKGVGKAAGVLGRSIRGVFRKKEEGEKTTWSEKITGSSERELAKQFGVDVYTTNPYLKEILARMARARTGGKGVMTVAKLLIPLSLASVALTVSDVNSAADQLANDLSRPELYRANEAGLERFGFSQADIQALLNSVFLTPREVTYLRTYFEKLHPIKGLEAILKEVLKAYSIEEARKILYETQIAAMTAEKTPCQKVRVLKLGIALQCGEQVIFAAPYDYLDQSALAMQILHDIENAGKEWNATSLEIRNGGKLAPAFFASVKRKGINAKERLLWSKSF